MYTYVYFFGFFSNHLTRSLSLRTRSLVPREDSFAFFHISSVESSIYRFCCSDIRFSYSFSCWLWSTQIDILHCTLYNSLNFFKGISATQGLRNVFTLYLLSKKRNPYPLPLVPNPPQTTPHPMRYVLLLKPLVIHSLKLETTVYYDLCLFCFWCAQLKRWKEKNSAKCD